VIQEQTESLYLTSPSGELFTNPLFLLATCFAVKPSPVAPELPIDGGRSVEVWISPDPVGQFASPYAYSSDPINSIDPDGMFAANSKSCEAFGSPEFEGYIDDAQYQDRQWQNSNGWPLLPVTNAHTWDPVSDRRIATLDFSLQKEARSFINGVDSDLGLHLRIVQGTRTYTEQENFYAQGRTAPGPIVTNARGYQSPHNFGLAFDALEIRNRQLYKGTNWNVVGPYGESKGWDWGGRWKGKLHDQDHFQRYFP